MLTKAEILAIKPGRELDELVAEKVMATCWTVDNETVFIWGKGGGGSTIFSPSTDMTAAWKVVEKMREAGYFIRLADQEEFIRVRFYNPDFLPVEKPSWIIAETVPETICKAALLVMEGEK